MNLETSTVCSWIRQLPDDRLKRLTDKLVECNDTDDGIDVVIDFLHDEMEKFIENDVDDADFPYDILENAMLRVDPEVVAMCAELEAKTRELDRAK